LLFKRLGKNASGLILPKEPEGSVVVLALHSTAKPAAFAVELA
jgi:hypothetical protein